MLNRRHWIAGAAALAFTATAAHAQDCKTKYPELVFAKVPDENASGTSDRWTPLANYLSKELGIKVTLRIANDYAAVIEGQRAGNIHIAMYGPASYARAYVTGAKVEPFAIEVSGDGTMGYYSVLYVKKDSPYQKIEDLKGKNLCLVDPNSTSGNNVPRFAMNKMGIDPDKLLRQGRLCRQPRERGDRASARAPATRRSTGGTTRRNRTCCAWSARAWRRRTTSASFSSPTRSSTRRWPI